MTGTSEQGPRWLDRYLLDEAGVQKAGSSSARWFRGCGAFLLAAALLLAPATMMAQTFTWSHATDVVHSGAPDGGTPYVSAAFNNTPFCQRIEGPWASTHVVYVRSPNAPSSPDGPHGTEVSYARGTTGSWTTGAIASFYPNSRVYRPTLASLDLGASSPPLLAASWIETKDLTPLRYRVVVAFSYDGGATWSDKSILRTSAKTSCGYPCVIGTLDGVSLKLFELASGAPGALICWTNRTAGVTCRGGEYSGGSWTFGGAQVVSALLTNAQDVSVAGSGSKAYLVFDDYDQSSGQGDVYFVRGSRSGGAWAWGTPTNLTASNTGPLRGNDASVSILPGTGTGYTVLVTYHRQKSSNPPDGGITPFDIMFASSASHAASDFATTLTTVGQGFFPFVQGVEGEEGVGPYFVVSWEQSDSLPLNDSAKHPGSTVSTSVSLPAANSMCTLGAYTRGGCPGSTSLITSCSGPTGVDVFWVDVAAPTFGRLMHTTGSW